MTPHNSSYMIGVLLGALTMGGLWGLMPLLIGKSRNNLVLGIIGFICSVIGGLLLGIILAAPVAIVFTVIILATNRTTPRM